MDYRLLIARRYLASPKRVSLISTITAISRVGVVVGVAALIVVLSVMNGFFGFVRDMLVSMDPHVRIVSAEERGLAAADSIAELALTLDHVQEALPYVEGKALLVKQGGSEVNKVVIVRGLNADATQRFADGALGQGAGTFEVARQDGRRPGAILGWGLGQRLGLPPGEDSRIALLSAQGIERMVTQVFGAPQMTTFDVRGLYQLQEVYDENYVFIDLPEAQRLFRMRDRVSGIELRLDDLEQADGVKAQLQQRLGAERFTVETWYDLQKSLYDVMKLEKWGASAVLVLIVIVAVFNIIGSLTMVVIEKRRDIGVLQAMGVSKRNIRRIFLTEGLLIGLTGTGLGLLLGLGLAWAQQQFDFVKLSDADSFMIDAYPVVIEATDVALIAVVAMVLCVLAAYYPATRAAAIEPATAVQMDG
ncbi:MAG: FtsX-like permease family protein [Bacteroidota bacterium]